MFNRLLVPIDGSGHAERALDMAIDFALEHDADLHILHVVGAGEVPPELRYLSDRPQLPPSASPNAAPVYEREIAKDVAEALIQDARRRAEQAGIERVYASWEIGPAGTRILKYAKRNGIDAIVMGARGLGTLTGLLVGSVSHKIQNMARCSVITVR